MTAALWSEAALAAVLALHTPRTELCLDCAEGCDRCGEHAAEVCAHCYVVDFMGDATGWWPCATVRAVRAAEAALAEAELEQRWGPTSTWMRRLAALQPPAQPPALAAVDRPPAAT